MLSGTFFEGCCFHEGSNVELLPSEAVRVRPKGASGADVINTHRILCDPASADDEFLPADEQKKPEVRISTLIETFIPPVKTFERIAEENGFTFDPADGGVVVKVTTTSALRQRTRTCTPLRSYGAPPGDASCFTISREPGGGDRFSMIEPEFDPHNGLRRSAEVSTVDDDWRNKFTLEGELGKGAFGTVLQLQRKSDGKRFAMKVVPGGNLNAARLELEFAVSRRLCHPHIVGLHELYRGDACELNLVMELCTGGDLFTKVARSVVTVSTVTIGGLPTYQVSKYTWQMLSGAAYLHHYRFAHRDIKLENYMLSDHRDGAPLKLIDFGLARQYVQGTPMRSRVGTPSYCAPEVFMHGSPGYDERVDIWSIGVSVFVMACSCFPFDGADPDESYRMAAQEQPDFQPKQWVDHPKELVALINLMLTKSGCDRPSARMLLENPWLKRVNSATPCCVVS